MASATKDDAARPKFALAFRAGVATPLLTFEDVTQARETADFIWVHVNLKEPAAATWLRAQVGSAEVAEALVERIARVRLFFSDTAIYGQLRDFRSKSVINEPLKIAIVSVFFARHLVLTGEQAPVVGLQSLAQKVKKGGITAKTTHQLLVDYLACLNNIVETSLENATAELAKVDKLLLKRRERGLQRLIARRRRQSLRVARDMAYKRGTMVEFFHAKPEVLSCEDFTRLRVQISRYAAFVEDAQDIAHHWEFLQEEYRAQVAEETNKRLYFLTVVSAGFLPVTAIGGLWGMNVGGIPLAENGFGFLIASGIGVATAGGLMVLLRFLRVL